MPMTDDMLGTSPICISSMCHMYMTDFVYFLVPLSQSYPSSPQTGCMDVSCNFGMINEGISI